MFNEFHAKNTSQKVRNVFRNKGMSGAPLTTNPPYGYRKSLESTKQNVQWIVDEPAAEIVRQIFAWCVEGLGPTQIAKRLKAAKVMTPTEYWSSTGKKCSKPPSVPYNWCSATVADILSKQEYCGDTINFRYTTRSFKNKKKIDRPQEEWRVFPDTHPAIIDRETFKLVQELRQRRRRPTKTGIVSPFSGLLYCADCGEKLYYGAANNYKREQALFFCSSYRKATESCTAHFIREKVVFELALESMQRVLKNVQIFEKEFARKQMECYSEDKKKELAEKRREQNKAKRRITEIDGLIQKLYEDNAKGKLSDDRYATLSMAYEEEQQKLKAALPEMQTYLETETDKAENLQRFIDKVKKLTEIKELTPGAFEHGQLAGVSVRRVEDITEALWGSKVSPSTISELNKKACVQIEEWRNRPLQGGGYPYVYVDGIYLRRNWGGEYENVSVLVAIAVHLRLPFGALDQDSHQQRDRTAQQGDPAPDESGRMLPGRELGSDAGLCPAAACGRNTVGQQKLHEHEAFGDAVRRRLSCWLTSLNRVCIQICAIILTLSLTKHIIYVDFETNIFPEKPEEIIITKDNRAVYVIDDKLIICNK